MNRFQYDNIDPDITAKEREAALKANGINTRTYIRDGRFVQGLSTGKRKAIKQKSASRAEGASQ